MMTLIYVALAIAFLILVLCLARKSQPRDIDVVEEKPTPRGSAVGVG